MINCADYVPIETIKNCDTCANQFCQDHPIRKGLHFTQEPFGIQRKPESCEAYRDFLRKTRNQWSSNMAEPCQFCADPNCAFHPRIIV